MVLRPDDVWIAILTQLSFFVNGEGRAEELRNRLVGRKGQEGLTIETKDGLDTIKFGDVVCVAAGKTGARSALRDWMVPDFTTTTTTDRAAASIIIMATPKSYFKYLITSGCGLPAVTLQGEKRDWEKLADGARGLAQYGPETAKWYSLLMPVLTRFISTFDGPTSASTLDFWKRINHHQPEGSHATYLSGWITAFCFFDCAGRSLYNKERPEDSISKPLVLDGVVYHQVSTKRIPSSYASVPLKLSANGMEVPAYMVAGSVGTNVSVSGIEQDGHDGKFDSMQPVVGWWVFRQTQTRNGYESERGRVST